eukprot:gene2196-2624_t
MNISAAVRDNIVQGKESPLFLSYFKKDGIEYLPGGVKSGFHHEVTLSSSSLTTSDVFILDAGAKIYLYIGETSNMYEKAKGVEVAASLRLQNSIRDETDPSIITSQSEVVHINEDPQNPAFWALLGGETAITNPGESDDVEEETKHSERRLFRVETSPPSAGTTGVPTFTPISLTRGWLERPFLTSDGVYLVDADGGLRLSLWVGSAASRDDKRGALHSATIYAQKCGYSAHLPIERVLEGVESAEFKQRFAVWTNPPPPVFGGVAKPVPSDPNAPVDVKAILAQKAPEEEVIDNATGNVKVWVIQGFGKEIVPNASFGHFFAGDCYLVLYTYKDKSNRQRSLLYYWIGDQATIDEQGTCALLAKNMNDEAKGGLVLIRVTQGKEPKHFCMLFQGHLIIYSGGRNGGFRSVSSSQEGERQMGASTATTRGSGRVTLPDPGSLFHVRGSSKANTYALQVPAVSSSLNSGDAFIVVTKEKVFVWTGKYASTAELEVAQNIGHILVNYLEWTGRLLESIEEGNEPEEFWIALGGKGPYAEYREGDAAMREPRLFHVLGFGSAVEEVYNFEQEDLLIEDCFILDVYTQVYLWVGAQASAQERERAEKVAQAFVSQAQDGRGSVPLVTVQCHHEPPMFTGLFPSWDFDFDKHHKFTDPYQAKLEALRTAQKGEPGFLSVKLRKTKIASTEGTGPTQAPEGTPPPAPAPTIAPPPPEFESGKTVWTYEELKHVGAHPGVDPSQKEKYLSDEEFLRVF